MGLRERNIMGKTEERIAIIKCAVYDDPMMDFENIITVITFWNTVIMSSITSPYEIGYVIGGGVDVHIEEISIAITDSHQNIVSIPSTIYTWSVSENVASDFVYAYRATMIDKVKKTTRTE